MTNNFSGITFLFKKPSQVSKCVTEESRAQSKGLTKVSNTSRNLTSASSLNKIFDCASDNLHADSNTKSLSTITELSNKGFNETNKINFSNEISVIACPNRLPRPSKRGISNPIQFINRTNPSKDTQTNENSNNSYGLLNTHNDSSSSLKTLETNSENEDIQKLIADDIEDVIASRKRLYQHDQLQAENRDIKKHTHTEPLLATSNRRLYELRKQYATNDNLLFQKELSTLPEFSYASFDSVPVESFGLAMLAGMGYDPQIHSTEPVQLKKRAYQHAGLGADKEFEKNK